VARKTIQTYLRLNGRQFRTQLARTKRDLRQFRSSANRIMRGLVIGFTAVAAAAGLIGGSFEQGMANIAAVSHATETQLTALEDRARELGSTTAYSAREVSNAMTVLAKSGLTVEENIGAVEAVLKLAGSEMADMTTTAELMVSTMRAFDIPFSEAAMVANTLAASAQQSRMSVERLADSLKYGAPIAKQLGLSFAEVTAAMSILVDNGMEASQAGTNLRAALKDLIAPSGDLARHLGNVDLRGQGLAGTLDHLRARHLVGEEAFKQFNVRGANAIAILGDNRDRLEQLTGSITGTNAAWEAYDRQMDTVQGQAKILRSALEELALQFFDTFRVQLKEAITRASTWVQDNSATIVEHLTRVKDAVVSLGGRVVDVFRWMGEHRTLLDYVVTTLGVLAGVIYTVATATAVWNAVAALNPWTWVVAAVVALGVAIVKVIQHMGGWGNTWRAALAWIITGARILGRWGALLGDYFGAIGTAIGDLWTRVGLTVAAVAEELWGTLRAFGSKMADIFSSVWELIRNPLAGAKAVANLKAALTEGWGDVTSNLAARVAGVWEGFGGGFGAAMGDATARAGADVQRLVDDTKARIAALRAEAGGQEAAGPYEQFPGGQTVPAAPYLEQPPWENLAGSLDTETDKARTVWEEFTGDLSNSMGTAWESILDKSRTGSQKWGAIALNMARVGWSAIGQWLMKQLAAYTTDQAAHQANEQLKTQASVQGAAGRIAAAGTEMAVDKAQQGSNITTAATGFFKAFSGIPFIGIALAIAAIGSMYAILKNLPGMAEGGLFRGRPGRDSNLAWLTDGEYVMPPRQTREHLGLLEALRSGRMGAALAGAGGVTVYAPIQVPRGSTIFTDDDMSLRRFGEKVGEIIQEKVARTFRDPDAE